MTDQEDIGGEDLAAMDDQIHDLELWQDQLETRKQALYQELERLYSELMANFEARWPRLRIEGGD